MPKIVGLAEVVLNVDDLPKMRQFYMDVLGFELHSEGCFESEDLESPTGKVTITFLTVNKGDTPFNEVDHPLLFVLIDYKRHGFARGKFQNRSVRNSSLNHLAFEVAKEDLDKLRAELNAKGIETNDVVFENMHAKSVFFRDPEDNTLEFICPIE